MGKILLDAAFPPSPQQWVTDMNAVGADGGFVYIIGPITHYSPAHISAARQAGKLVVPIVVPGNFPMAVSALLATLKAYGFVSGPVVLDYEQGSEPPDSWNVSARATLDEAGYMTARYGTVLELGKYTPDDEDWIASWLRKGSLDPVPELPAGRNAWQFVDDVLINGSQYDVSVVDDLFAIGADVALLDDIKADVDTVRTKLDALYQSWEVAGGAHDPNGAAIDVGWTIGYMWNAISRIEEEVGKLTGPPAVDVEALASALAPHLPPEVDVNAVADAVLKQLGTKLA